ncbi:hypothetical protein HID58_066569 [Brassica napus]|uniref:Uncharacterized protein n=1 Tax=Brassica napus TaxID=3708 RepID=A0ABQ7ZGJ8_BRANA|nr:hypothetical protein HID58_066569 [Brassica napus]
MARSWLPDSSVLCSYDGTGVEPYNLCFRQPVPHRCLIVRFFVSVAIAGPGLGLPCFAGPLVGVAFGTVPVARLSCDLLILNGCSVFFHMPSFSLVFRDCG